MATGWESAIRDLGVVGNQRTAALLDRCARVLWYCPGRFDRASLFGALLDPQAGIWEICTPRVRPARRRYLGESGVLETVLDTTGGEWTWIDWMPLGPEGPAALCRQASPAPVAAEVEVAPRPDYGRTRVRLSIEGAAVVINGGHYLYSSHSPHLVTGSVHYKVPPGERSWFVLADAALAPSASLLDQWRALTLRRWEDLHHEMDYNGAYEREVRDSLRALRLLTFADNGGIIAAATLGLPEVIGGERNYDYRYVWLRDAAMITSALVRAGSKGSGERRFLSFLCGAQREEDDAPLPPLTTLDGDVAPPLEALPWCGYRGSRPVAVGNGAGLQLQLDGLANILLAAKLIYDHHDTRDHWEVVERVADYLADHWDQPDNGIWEEPKLAHYTSSKVIVARSLEFIAEHSEKDAQARHWRAAAGEIRAFIERHCRARDGAYAAVAGGDAVDVSAALFPVWDFTAPDTPAMLATITRLERDYSRDGLFYRRHLECFDSRREGAFLAGSLWVAQYWIMRDAPEQAERILKAVLACSNDLGLMSEEAGPDGEMLGNIPQAFVHASLIGMVIDLKKWRNEHAPV